MSGAEAKIAAATSEVSRRVPGYRAFLSHVATAARSLWSACAVRVLVGRQLGLRLIADRLRPRAVRLICGVVLLGTATLILIEDVPLA